MFLQAVRAAAIGGAFLSALSGGPILDFAQTNLVSDGAVPAAFVDPDLKNPWGTSSSPTSPIWVSDNGTGLATLYNTSGAKQGLVVSIPAPGGGAAAPTGQVFNGTGGAFNGDLFIFATEDGSIAGWRGALGTTAETLFDSTAGGAVYKGLAIGSTGQGTYLYAADFHNNRIDVFGSGPALAGNFTDPNLPAGFAPFNVQVINNQGTNQVYVTYAMQDGAGHDDVPGAGNGYVSVFDLNGNFVKRLASGGALNSPWGLALAPAGFGGATGDLLVGNFGDGTINAFDLTGTLVGTIADVGGNPLVNDGLWALKFGNGGNGGNANSLYLTAGLNGEADGLFAQVDAVPEPGTVALLCGGVAILWVRRRASTATAC
jgi:uncharacterized protein (TIGR03118 family)